MALNTVHYLLISLVLINVFYIINYCLIHDFNKHFNFSDLISDQHFNMERLVFLLLSLVPTSHSINIDTQWSLRGPGPVDDCMFGFSVAQHRSGQKSGKFFFIF